MSFLLQRDLYQSNTLPELYIWVNRNCRGSNQSWGITAWNIIKTSNTAPLVRYIFWARFILHPKNLIRLAFIQLFTVAGRPMSPIAWDRTVRQRTVLRQTEVPTEPAGGNRVHRRLLKLKIICRKLRHWRQNPGLPFQWIILILPARTIAPCGVSGTAYYNAAFLLKWIPAIITAGRNVFSK